jgi:hypothetical protein
MTEQEFIQAVREHMRKRGALRELQDALWDLANTFVWGEIEGGSASEPPPLTEPHDFRNAEGSRWSTCDLCGMGYEARLHTELRLR